MPKVPGIAARIGGALAFLWFCFLPQSAGLAAPAARAVQATSQGVSLLGQYQYGPAVVAFEEALAVEPALATVKINLAIALFNRNQKADQDFERAVKLLDEVLGKEADNVRALYFRGILYQHGGQAEAAAGCFEKVVQRIPTDGAAWYLLGVCKQRLGQTGEPELLRAVQCRPFLFSACYKLSQIAMRAGKEEQARQFLDRFTRLRQSPLGEAIELPQYEQMGELALAQPLDVALHRPATTNRFSLGPARTLDAVGNPPTAGRASETNMVGGPVTLSGAAAADFDGDGAVDLIVIADRKEGSGKLWLWRGSSNGTFRDATAGSGLEPMHDVLSCAIGDYDNDGRPDLFVAGCGGNHLLRGKGDGAFEDVTGPTGTGGGPVLSAFAMFLDVDHDGDLDILVCNTGSLDGKAPSPNQLLRNNGDGTFTDIAREAGLDCGDYRSVYAVAGDLNGDRATDLVFFSAGQPARVFLNELFGQFREIKLPSLPILGERGAVLQDFDGDGRLDLAALGGERPTLRLWLGDGHGYFQGNTPFDVATGIASTWGALRGLRAADIDLNGDLDLIVFGDQPHCLLNDGHGAFVPQDPPGTLARSNPRVGVELLDLTGDFVPDLLCLDSGPTHRIVLLPGEVSSPHTALGILPTGLRSRDGRTRSPVSGYGVKLTARAGLWERTVVHTGLWGGPNQSLLPVVIGLGGAAQADYVNLLWTDGVNQVETGVAAGRSHAIAETQRKISSCPVLFAWNGQRFEFITDFAGVGGLGYFSAPGVSAPPQVLEHVKLEPGQLAPRNGVYELRVTEPMEETAFVDQLELLAIDHPADLEAYPDERLAIEGPPPTHRLVTVSERVFALSARGPGGEECADRLRRVDRVYAYEPPLDRRYIGFCHPHTLELDFGDGLSTLGATGRVFLFIEGSIEYPYSQTVYAARQSRIGWEPIRIDCIEDDGQWHNLVPDAGVFGGTARMMTVELTGKLNASSRRLRLRTNLELYYDQIFIGRDAGLGRVKVQSLSLSDALLRRAGFAREYSPDGRLPWIYDYDQAEPSAPFRVLRGAYTRYGPVKELLTDFDDKYVLIGPGDELALRFQASELEPIAAGMQRSFVLVSHAWCKDMDLYTAAPQTLEPLPFRKMSCYPYPPEEHYPDTEEYQAFFRKYNTRMLGMRQWTAE